MSDTSNENDPQNPETDSAATEGEVNNAGTSDQASSAPPPAPTLIPVVHRPWLAPVVASGIAALVLLILLMPGVMGYPRLDTMVTPINPARIADQRSVNRALEVEIYELRQALGQGVCRADNGRYYPVTPELIEGGTEAVEPISTIPPRPDELQPSSLAVPPEASYEGDLQGLMDQGTVAIIRQAAGGGGIGSGFFVDGDHILTNAHVADDPEAQYFVLSAALGGARPASFIAATPSHAIGGPDFAVLRLDEAFEGVVPVSFASPVRGERVNAVGYPTFYLDAEVQSYVSGQASEVPPPAITDGQVVTLRQGNGVGLVPHTANISPGNSGGPLFDLCGRVVGVNTYGEQRNDGGVETRGNNALNSADATAFLRQHGVSPRVVESACGPSRSGGAPQAAQPETSEPAQDVSPAEDDAQ